MCRINQAVCWAAQAMFGVWRYDTPLYMGAMAEMMRRRGAASVHGSPKDLPQHQLVRTGSSLRFEALLVQYPSCMCWRCMLPFPCVSQ